MNHISHYRGALPHQIHPNHCPPLQNFPARFPSPTIPDNVNALMISQMANDGTLQYHNTNVQHFIVENRHMGQNTEPIKEPAQPTRKPERISTGFQTIETDANFKPSISSNTSQRLTHHCNRGAKNCAQCFKGQTKIMVDVSTMTDNDEMDQAASWASVTTQPGNTKVAEYLTSLRQFLKLSSPPEGKRRLGDVRIISSSDGTRLYCCPECHMAYPDKSLLEPHLAAHKIERRFICTVCGAGLKRKEHLDRHALSHSDERPYSCQLCPKTFKRNEHLARHAIVHTGHKGQIEKPWVCSTCGVGHARKEHLDRHLLCHTDERPFTCQVCAKSFKRHEHLLRHVIIHTGHKTEICPECGKGFYRKDHLRKHLQGHAAKKAKMAATAQNGSCSGANGGCSAANGGCSTANGACSAANAGCGAANGGCSAANGGCSVVNNGCSAANGGCSAANGGCNTVNQTIQHQTPVSVASQHHNDANALLPPLPSAPKFEAFSEYKGKL